MDADEPTPMGDCVNLTDSVICLNQLNDLVAVRYLDIESNFISFYHKKGVVLTENKGQKFFIFEN
jgi:hypothetical protein